MTHTKLSLREVYILAKFGGLAFWLTNLAISLIPIAAEYRNALSIAYMPMLVEALIGGLLIGLLVGYLLLRFHDRLPGKSPVVKALILSGIALVLVTLLVEVQAKFLGGTEHAMRYFLIAAAFNVLRFSALGVGVSLRYARLKGGK